MDVLEVEGQAWWWGSRLRRVDVALGAVLMGVGTGRRGRLCWPSPTPAWLSGTDSPHPTPPRYPSVACEILTSDVPQINDALGADESLLNRLYGFLQSDGCLNPLLASFFSKVMGVLINRKTDQVRLRSWGHRAGGWLWPRAST